MRKTPIEYLPIVKHFAEYFTRKAKVALGLKKEDYKSVSIDYSSRGTVYVWFHGSGANIIGWIRYKADGTRL